MHPWLSTLPRNVFSTGLYSAAHKASSVIPCERHTVSTLVPSTRQAPAVSCDNGDELSDNCWLMAISIIGEPVLEVASSPCRFVNALIRDSSWNPTDEWHDAGVEVNWMLWNQDLWWGIFGDRANKSVKMMIKWVSAFMLQGAQFWIICA